MPQILDQRLAFYDSEANNIQIGAFALEPDTEYSLSVTVTDVTDQHLQIYCAQCTITE